MQYNIHCLYAISKRYYSVGHVGFLENHLIKLPFTVRIDGCIDCPQLRQLLNIRFTAVVMYSICH